MSEKHQPDPEFLGHLKWQVRTAYQRQDRFSTPSQPKGRAGAKMIGLVLVSAFCGAGAVLATDAVQESRAQEILLTRIQGELEVASVQVQMAQEALDEIRRQVDQGLVPQEAAREAEVGVQQGQIHLQRLGLDREEILASGKEPNDHLSAPLVGGRDFVSARLELDLNHRRLGYMVVQERFLRISGQSDLGSAGAVEESDQYRARMELYQLAQNIQGWEQRQDLRQQFVEGDLTVQEVDRELEIVIADQDVKQTELAYMTAAREFEDVQQSVAQGVLGERDLTRARMELMQVGVHLNAARRTLELLTGEE